MIHTNKKRNGFYSLFGLMLDTNSSILLSGLIILCIHLLISIFYGQQLIQTIINSILVIIGNSHIINISFISGFILTFIFGYIVYPLFIVCLLLGV